MGKVLRARINLLYSYNRGASVINSKLENLYRTYYGDSYANNIPCGVVDEETYANIYPKIVFILREPHSDEIGWSLQKGLKRNVEKGLKGISLEKNYMYTWRQAGVWAYSIVYGFDSYSVLKKDIYVAKGLRAIGMTNLKKTGGKASSNLNEISYYATKEKELWQKELEIMNPDLVICGSTYQDVQRNLGLDKLLLFKIDGKTYFYSVGTIGLKQYIILDFWHPALRKSRENTLSDLKLLISELKHKGFL